MITRTVFTTDESVDRQAVIDCAAALNKHVTSIRFEVSYVVSDRSIVMQVMGHAVEDPTAFGIIHIGAQMFAVGYIARAAETLRPTLLDARVTHAQSSDDMFKCSCGNDWITKYDCCSTDLDKERSE